MLSRSIDDAADPGRADVEAIGVVLAASVGGLFLVSPGSFAGEWPTSASTRAGVPAACLAGGCPGSSSFSARAG